MRTIFLLVVLSFFLQSCTYYLGPNRWAKSFDKNTEIVVPNRLDQSELTDQEKIKLSEDLLLTYKDKKIKEWSNKYQDTVLDVRIILNQLAAKQNVAYINKTIKEFKAWGTTGTSHKLNKMGDYDFRQILWSYMVWQFTDDVLYKDTKAHIIDKLIIDNGNKPTLKAPKLLGLVRETENHILMKEGSRYLKNQWLYNMTKEAQYNNKTNGMETFLLGHIEEMYHTGLFEFNSVPYASFTFDALYVIHDCVESEAIKKAVRKVINKEHWIFALGSFTYKRFPPFRRQLSKEKNKGLYDDRQSFFVKVNELKNQNKSIRKEDLPCCENRIVIPLLSTYQMPEQVLTMLQEKPKETYYTRVGHGIKASPEIYSGRYNYLLSAGGLRFGKRSQIVPRATTLFLNDGAQKLSDCFHIPGKGNLNQWNNTGVYKNFAVGNQPVNIPQVYMPEESFNNWQIFKLENGHLWLGVYNASNLGILYLAENYNQLKKTIEINADQKELYNSFVFSNAESISYQLNSKKKWVITKINGEKTTRKFGNWQQLNLTF